MSIDAYVAELRSKGHVVTRDGRPIPVGPDSSTLEGCLLLREPAVGIRSTVVIEVGLALGISTLYIAEALQRLGGIDAISPSTHSSHPTGMTWASATWPTAAWLLSWSTTIRSPMNACPGWNARECRRTWRSWTATTSSTTFLPISCLWTAS